MSDGPRWSIGRLAATLALVVLGGLVLAAVVPPRAVEYGGGDEENYLANGVRQATGPEAAYEFLPPEWARLPDDERAALSRAFLDADGRMFRLVGLPPGADDQQAPVLDPAVARKKATVDDDGRIRIAHDNLYATFLAGLVFVEGRDLPILVNDVMLVAAGLFMGLTVLRVVRRRWAAVLAGVLLVALPSMVEAARVTRTETFASLLFLVFVWWTTRDEGRTAWPGLMLVALWATRHEFIVPLMLYLVWAAWRRKDGGWAVVAATVVTAYVHPWGLADPGELFAASRDVFARLPGVPAWVLLPGYLGARWVGDRSEERSDRWAEQWHRIGERPAVHRVAWSALFLGAAVAEALRRTLDVGEQGWFVLKGPNLSTLDVLIDSVGVPLLLLGGAGLVWVGYRLAGRIPFVVALVTVPHAYVLIRMGVSGEDLWAWSRRFHIVVYPVLILGLILLLVALADRITVPGARAAVVAGVTVVAVVPMVLIHGDRPVGDAPTRADADGFHDSVDRLADDAVVVLAPAFGSQKAQLPIRVHGDRWSYIVWDDEAAVDALAEALPCLDDRAVYAEDEVLDVLAAAGAEARGAEITLAARYNEGPGRDIALREVVPTGACGF